MTDKEIKQEQVPNNSMEGSLTSDDEVRVVQPTGKRSWPEVVELTAEEAEKKIKEDMNDAKVSVVPIDSFITMDYRTDRVRIFVDPSGKVSRPPTIG